MPKRIGPEAKIISLFTALPDESKRIVLDVIKSQQIPRKSAPKSSAPSAGKKSSRSAEQKESTASTEAARESAGNAKGRDRYVPVCALPDCGLEEFAPIHRPESENYHVFHSELKKKAAA